MTVPCRTTVAQSWRMKFRRDDNRPSARPPMMQDVLERLAMHYVARYATSSAKLRAYLLRKCRERASTDEPAPDIDALVSKIVMLGYVDDTAYAELKTAALGRRGYGARRIGAALRDAGIERDTAHEIMAASPIDPATAVKTYLQRRRLGPYGTAPRSREVEQRVTAALLRAGHRYDDVTAALSDWQVMTEER